MWSDGSLFQASEAMSLPDIPFRTPAAVISPAMFQGSLPTVVTFPAMVAVLLLSLTSPASAQSRLSQNVYQPLNARMTPGLVGRLSAQAGRSGPSHVPYFQPVEVRLANTGPSGGGRVTWFSAGQGSNGAVTAAAPHTVGLLVGATYRVQISDMPAFPGVKIYPTIEMIDRLHPPTERRYEFPVPVELTGEDIRLALSGHLVTRVVFLEEPRLSAGNEQTRPMMVRDLDPRANALAEADRSGRPMVILRLGSRSAPSGQADDFFHMGHPRQPIELSRSNGSTGVSRFRRSSQAPGRLEGSVRIRSAGSPRLQVAGGDR